MHKNKRTQRHFSVLHLAGTICSILDSEQIPYYQRWKKIMQLITFKNALLLWLHSVKQKITRRDDFLKEEGFAYYALVSVDSKGDFVGTGFVWNKEKLDAAMRGHFQFAATKQLLIIDCISGKLTTYHRPETYIIPQN